jgi:hypothetical protein
MADIYSTPLQNAVASDKLMKSVTQGGGMNPMAIMGGINAGLSLIDGLLQAGKTRQAREALQNMDIPPAEKFYLDAQLMEAARVGDPDIFTAAVQGPSAMEGISEDPRLRQAQMQEITGLQQLAETGGTPQMEADLMRTQTGLGTTLRGAREAALQNMASRGMAGSGMEAAQQASAQQAAITGASQAGADIAAQRERMRMQALQGLGGAGGRMRGQEFGQASAKASAADEIARRNIGARNQAQQFNIQAQQQAREFNAQQSMREAQARADAERTRAQMEQQKNIALTQM